MYTIGYPGALRIIILFLISRQYGVEITGVLVYKWAIVTFASMLAVDGGAALLSSRVPKSTSNKEECKYIRQQISNGAIFNTAFIFFWYISTDNFNYADVLFIFSWLLYGLQRRVQLLNSNYFKLAVFETILLIFIVTILLFVDLGERITLLFLPLGVSSFFLLGKLYTFSVFKFEPNFELKWFQFGLNNVFSGGVAMALIPYIAFKFGTYWAGYVGLIISILNIVLLLPRAISIYYMPLLSKNIKAGCWVELYKKFNQYINYGLFLFFLVSPLLWITFSSSYFHAGNSVEYIYIYYAICFSMIVSQLSLSPSNLYISMENPRVLFFSNIVFSVAVVFFILILHNYNIFEFSKIGFGIVLIYLLLGGLHLIRFVYLSYMVRNYLISSKLNDI